MNNNNIVYTSMPLKVNQEVWFLDNIGDINLKHGKIYFVDSMLQSYNDVEYGTTKYYYVHKYDVQRPVTNEIHKNVHKVFLTEREGLEYIIGTLSVSIAVQENERKQCLQRIDWLEDEISAARTKIEEIQERLTGTVEIVDMDCTRDIDYELYNNAIEAYNRGRKYDVLNILKQINNLWLINDFLGYELYYGHHDFYYDDKEFSAHRKKLLKYIEDKNIKRDYKKYPSPGVHRRIRNR